MASPTSREEGHGALHRPVRGFFHSEGVASLRTCELEGTLRKDGLHRRPRRATWALRRHERRATWALHTASRGATWALLKDGLPSEEGHGTLSGNGRCRAGHVGGTVRHERRATWALQRRPRGHVGPTTSREEGHVGPSPASEGPRGPYDVTRGGPRGPSNGDPRGIRWALRRHERRALSGPLFNGVMRGHVGPSGRLERRATWALHRPVRGATWALRRLKRRVPM